MKMPHQLIARCFRGRALVRPSALSRSVARTLGLLLLMTMLWPASTFAMPVTSMATPQTSPSSPVASPPDHQADMGLIWDFPGGIDHYRDAPYVPGRLLLGLHRDGQTPVRAAGVAVALPASLTGELEILAIDTLDLRGMDGRAGDAGIDGYILSVPPGREWATIEWLRSTESVAFVSPDFLVFAADRSADIAPAPTVQSTTSAGTIEAAFPVNDPLYQTRQWYLQRINASRAWTLAQTTPEFARATIQVAVIDSGVDITHPELKSVLLPGKNYVTPASEPVDDYGHGTHVSGVIAATLNNDAGQAGLSSWVRIDPRKVLNFNGSGSISNVAQSIRDAVDDGAQIINMSLEASFTNSVLESAILYASAKGALLVAAGGNCSGFSCPLPVRWPAAYTEVIAVGATDRWDVPGSYSAIGDEIEIAAPGGSADSVSNQIYSTWAIDAAGRCVSTNGDYRVQDGGSYCATIGTSMAASVVSGLAALIWSMEPDLVSEDVRAILGQTATDVSAPANRVGHGRIDADAALRSLLSPTLNASVDQLNYRLAHGSDPFTVTVSISNPSLQAVDWIAELSPATIWAGMVITDQYPATGRTLYGAPDHVVLEISPTNLLTGTYATNLTISGVSAANQTRALPPSDLTPVVVPISLQVDVDAYHYYLPAVLSTGIDSPSIPIDRPSFSWETPVSEADRVVRTLGNNANFGLSLPFDFPLKGETQSDIVVYSDGMVLFPSDGNRPTVTENRCLPDTAWPHQAIYGWWADLDPSADGARVSYFQPTDDRFVIEYFNVPSAAEGDAAYRVSFQIVLDEAGVVEVNYLSLPIQVGAPPQATVGIEAIDGLFHNQVFCADGVKQLGAMPQSNQSFVFIAEDIY